MASNLKIRVMFTLLVFAALAVSAGMAAYFWVSCEDLANLPGLHKYLLNTIYVIFGLLCLNAVVAVLCIALILAGRPDITYGFAFHLFFSYVSIGFACWSFHNDGIRFEYNANGLHFQLYENWTLPGVLYLNASIASRRRYDYNNYLFIDGIQNAFHCCGLNNYWDYHNDTNITTWLREDLVASCRDPPDYRNRTEVDTVAEYCNPIFKTADTDLPASCCKNKFVDDKDCNKNVFNGTFNTDLINTEGCSTFLMEPFTKCRPVLPIIVTISFMFALYMCLVTYSHARKVQHSSFWNKFCCYCCWMKTTIAPISDVTRYIDRMSIFAKSRSALHATT